MKRTNNFSGTYRTKSGCTYVRFSFERQMNGDVHAYILQDNIDYLGQPSDVFTTHRIHDPDRQLYYVCWKPQPTSYDAALAVGKLWAEAIEGYAILGNKF